MNCRFCKHLLSIEFIDLGNSPLSNSYLTQEGLNEPEVYYPLKIFICENCFLVQIDEYIKSNEIFNNKYAYFSSFSTNWLTHAKNYTEMILNRFPINNQSLVIEIASNDGYLLQYFKEKNIPVLGIEPTSNTAEAARNKGIDSIIDYFGVALAKDEKLLKKADLLIGNNVLAHVPDINDFVSGLKLVLKPDGIITMEFPHLLQLIEKTQFDTIYHEHFSYISFFTAKSVFNQHKLEIFDVEEISTHGGSLRIYAKHIENNNYRIENSVQSLLQKEEVSGMRNLNYYWDFAVKTEKIKLDFLDFLIEQKKIGKKVAGYGAAAKGNTLLNYCGIKNDLIEFVVDASPAKQNKYLPGSHIPIVNEHKLKIVKPDYIIIFPWNITDEIMHQLDYVREWGGKFVILIPQIIIN